VGDHLSVHAIVRYAQSLCCLSSVIIMIGKRTCLPKCAYIIPLHHQLRFARDLNKHLIVLRLDGVQDHVLDVVAEGN
jgi:hypothetical protein